MARTQPSSEQIRQDSIDSSKIVNDSVESDDIKNGDIGIEDLNLNEINASSLPFDDSNVSFTATTIQIAIEQIATLAIFDVNSILTGSMGEVISSSDGNVLVRG